MFITLSRTRLSQYQLKLKFQMVEKKLEGRNFNHTCSEILKTQKLM